MQTEKLLSDILAQLERIGRLLENMNEPLKVSHNVDHCHVVSVDALVEKIKAEILRAT